MDRLQTFARLAALLGLSFQDVERSTDILMGQLGLDSLTATRVRSALFPQPTYQVLFGLTVAQVADLLVSQEKVVAKEAAQRLHVPFSLTPMQESYLMGANQGCPCQVYTEFDVENLDIGLFQQAVQFVIDRHPMLHAKIVNGSEQVICEQRLAPIVFTLKEVSDLEQRRDECMHAFQMKPDVYWDIQLTKLREGKVRIHLLLNMLFIDATSAMILFQEVGAAYYDLLKQGTIGVRVSTHREFYEYCKQIGNKEIASSSDDFWTERLNWMPGPPQLPRRKQSAIQAPHFQRLSFTLEESHCDAVKDFAVQLKVTLNAVLIAAFSEVIRFYSEEPDFSIAVTMSERPVEMGNDFTGVVGEFTNVILCPMKNLNRTIAEQALEIHNDLCESLEHSDLSGLEVIRRLRKHRADPHLSFPVVFTSFLGIAPKEIALEDCKTSLHFQQTQTPQISLDAQVYEWNGKLQINWDYDSVVYDKEVIAGMLQCFHDVLKHIGTHTACTLSPEVFQLRNQMNDTSHSFDADMLLHTLILRSAEKTPDTIAVIDQQVEFSYKEIVAIGKEIAARLQKIGIGPNCCVAIVMEKGWEQVAATLGVLLTGAFYLPLNASYPDERLRRILSLADCSAALVQEKTCVADRYWWQEMDVIPVHSGLMEQAGTFIPTVVDLDQLAYVIFTSGSTGEPKGVAISHRGAANTCIDMNQRFGLQSNTVTFAISSLSFDLSVWDIFGTLGAGGTVVICKPDGTRDPDYWWQQLQMHKITVWNSVPTSFEMLISARYAHGTLPLKMVFLSGDAISMNMIKGARTIFPDLRIVALGGATEASIWSNFHEITNHSEDLGTELAPYGRALSNQTMYVLDSNFQYRPDRVVGNIYIGGIGLAREYFRDPALTALKFIHAAGFGRVYATGDLGRYLPNGEIEILGRKDSQVKVGGHRVELAEIERCVGDLSFVERAAVIHLPHAKDRLIGFVTTNQDIKGLEQLLRRHIEQHLPDYMTPQYWILLKEMPTTANNKLDANKLRQIAAHTLEQNQDSPLSENNAEVTLILQLASQVMGVSASSLSPTQSLTEQGLSSLFAVQFINLLAESWNTRLSYTLVFNYPSAMKLAAFYQNLSLQRDDDRTMGSADYSSEPIAVISTACRLPGKVSSPEEFWKMLLAGTDCVVDVPSSRFDIGELYDPNPDAIGCSYTRRGAFLEQIESFDYSFFGISVAEARTMDPQQRMFLEVAYEAFYVAGYDRERLRNSFTGVFVGQMNYDWMTDFDHTTDYAGTSVAPSITANRISFLLDLAGPSMTIDTACSSSLVAVDAAITKLRAGGCRMAVAGGVNLILCSTPYVTTCQARMLSVNSRCATFDSRANGIARGEGVGAVVLKRLSDAQADGDPILAIIRGAAVNQDGKSASLTAPSGLAQEAVIKYALTNGGLTGRDVDYVECHGTGTPLGDPIEIEALKNVLNEGRDKPVVLGAVKTNIGHLEGAAGIIGLVKTVEVLRHRQAPGLVHFQTLNPKIDIQGFPVVLPTKPVKLEREDRIIAGISSFGYGGTNAHLVLESWDQKRTSRIASHPQILWMFTGQGALSPGIARPLYEGNSLFQDALQRYTALFEDRNVSLLHLLIEKDSQNLLQQTQYGQPALVALQLAQVAMWQERGFLPGTVVGHSIGEFAAAVVAGVIQAETAMQLAAIRGRLMSECPPGGMIAAFTNKERLLNLLPPDIFIAAVNGPSMTVLAGNQLTLQRFASAHLQEINHSVLPILHAFHSPFMEKAAKAFRKEIQLVKLLEPQISFISTLTGNQEKTKWQSADYWADQIVQPVQFMKAVQTAFSLPAQIQGVVEIGPQSTLIHMAKRFIADEQIQWVASNEAIVNVPKQLLFRSVMLPWKKPKTKKPVEKINDAQPLFESIWVPAKERAKKIAAQFPSRVLLLSRTAIAVQIPQNWASFTIQMDEDLLKILSQGTAVTVVFVSSGLEKDVELGLKLLQYVIHNPALALQQIIFVTQPQSTVDAGLLGLARTAQQEWPDIPIRCIACATNDLQKAILLALEQKEENELYLDDHGVLYASRICRLQNSHSRQGPTIRSDATYIISGGQGALGLVVASLLVQQGAKYLLLLSRSPRPADLIPELLNLKKQANIVSVACDVSQEDKVLQMRDWLVQHSWPAVRGIVHTAGVLTDGTISNQTVDKFQLAFGAKVHGACYLRAAFSPPDFLILFSSVAGLFGSVGQASYAAANATLDALAKQWAQAGEPVLSIQWGAWSEVGMAVRNNALKRAELAGFGLLSTALASNILQQLIEEGNRGVVCASPIDENRLILKNSSLKGEDLSTAKESIWNRSSLGQLVRESILQFVSFNKLDENPTFMEAGFSSLDLVQFRQHLMSRLPDFIELPVHFAFNYPTEQDVVAYLMEQLESRSPKTINNTKMWSLLNEQRAGEPLFLISGVVGTVDKTFGSLATAISRPVYATKPSIPAYIDPKKTTLESIAIEMKESMLREVPRANYTVGGLSFGAALAWEVGYQLEKEGKLAQVVLLDPRHMPPFQAPPMPAPFEILLERYTPPGVLHSPVVLFQCSVPPLEKQSEMMRETSRSFQENEAILSRCNDLCKNIETVPTEGHHFNFLYKHVQPIALRLEQKDKTPLLQNSYNEPIAVLSTACRLPGNVKTPEEFWKMLVAGTNCVTDIPFSRFDIDEVFDSNPDVLGRSYTRKAAFMQDVEYFDCDFFGISMAEARVMDPQQRILLEVAYEAFQQAGYDKARLRGSATGIYIGLANDDWTTMDQKHLVYSPHFSAGVSGSIASNRISYLFGLTGPSMTLDTACSSSLVAIDLAVEKLRQGICSLALVGGVNVMLHNRMFVSACATKALSKQGRCATFDESADGYCRGEGVGAVVLKRLSDAIADNDSIMAVIRATAVNQDGRSVSLTAPNGLAQEAVINQALAAAGVNGHEVDYVECHGTGTPLGDPIEVAALKNALGKGRKKPLVLGAVKTNIGHLEGAAGVVGFIKAVEVLRHRQAPGIVHFTTLNSNIDLDGFNVIMPTQPVVLGTHSNSSLLAGISSFGFGGTNAHVILESYSGSVVERPHLAYTPRFLPWRRLPHPFLSRTDEKGFVATLSGEKAAMWKDHAIHDQVLVPAASHITLLGGAALLKHKGTSSLGIEIHDVIMSRPLVVSDVAAIIHCVSNGNQWSIEEDSGEPVASCRSANPCDKIQADIDINSVRKRCIPTEIEPLYQSLSHQGVQFGPSYRNLVELYIGEGEAIARIQAKQLSPGDRSYTLLHPAILDAGIQLLGLYGMKTCGVCIPFNVQIARLFILEDQPQELWAYTRISASNSQSIEGAVTLFNEVGEVFAILEGLTCRQFNQDAQANSHLFEVEFVATSVPILALPEHVLIVSRIPLDLPIPSDWQTLIVADADTFSLTNHNTIVLLSSGTEADVALGLKLLQIAGKEKIKQIFFITAPQSDADAGLWGLARTFRLERPDIRLRCVECTMDKVVDAISYPLDFEDEFSVDQNGVRIRRMGRLTNGGSVKSISIRPDATYVISGGQGALGMVVAKFLVDQGAKYLLLLSRTPRPLKEIPELQVLNEKAKIECLACDVSQEESVLGARSWLLRHGWPGVRGIVHTAGVLTDGTIPNQSADKLQRAFGSKIRGARYLRSTFMPPDFLILFSSAAATFGSAGQASYSAANATLDALAETWSKAGEPVLSIQWGAWSEAGMAVRHDAVKRAEAAGFGSLSPQLGSAILEHLLFIGKIGTVCSSPIDWNRLALDMPLISRFKPKKQSPLSIQSSQRGYDKGTLLSLVRQAAKEAMGRLVSDDISLMANGLDSLSAVALAQTLSQKLGLTLGSVFALNYPTIDDMANALVPLVQETILPMSIPSPIRMQRSEEPIAIVGTACRLPGNIKSPEAFWDMLCLGRDCVTDIPISRFDIDAIYDPNSDAVGCSYTRRGAFMHEVEYFDANFFDILVAEARTMDPHQRLLLEVAYEAFHHAGYDKKRLRASSTGVFVGVANQDWMIVCGDEQARNPFFGVGVSSSIISNRISYLLGLTGPSMTLDTACSSSLVAVDLAVEKLRSGQCSTALVGGVNVMLHHRTFVGCCSAKMLSFKGRCAAFDASADGYCRGEGVGAVVLKRLSDAIAERDPILAVIRATAVNQDGRSATLTAPNGLAQEAVINQALAIAGLSGHEIDYVECHGTGTPLGDPIEVAALKNALGKGRKKPLVLGAVKTNIGHLEGAAGVVGFIKAVEVLRHRQAPGNVHFTTLNPKIDLNAFDAIIPTHPVALGTHSNSSLLAGISSFGFGGTNAHVILESYSGAAVERPRLTYTPQFLPWRRLPHPFLSRTDEKGFVATLSGEKAAMWKDHAIHEQVLVPAASHITLLGGAALLKHKGISSLGIEIHDVIMSRPLVVRDVSATIHCVSNGNQWSIEENSGETLASCRSANSCDKIHSDIDINSVRQRCIPTEIEPLYQALSHQGVQFGPSYRNLVELYIGEGEAIARIQVKQLSPGDRSYTLLHPAILDAGIQLLGLCGMKTCGVCIPFNVQIARLFTLEDQPHELWAYTRISASNSQSIEGTVTLFNEVGEVFAILEGLTCRQFNQDAEVSPNLFETKWVTANKPSVVMPENVLFISRIPLDLPIPSDWQTLIVDDSGTFLVPNNISTIALLSSGTEADVALGLKLLQIAGKEKIKQIFFITAPQSDADAGLWGLARTFRLERPDIRLRCVECTMDKVVDAISSSLEDEDELLIDTNGAFLVRRLSRMSTNRSVQNIVIQPDATYIISGGQGALGLMAAQFLVQHGAKYLLLLSRNPRPLAAIPELHSFAKQATIACIACDVSQKEHVMSANQWLIAHQWPSVHGIVHTAGVLTDSTIPNQSADKLRLAYGPKVDGAHHLRSIFKPPDFLVLFSSAAAIFGSAGQASYSAANATLDALAENWSKAGEPVLSIQWGAWSEVGMAVRHDAVKRAEASGFGSISSHLGTVIFEHLLFSGKRGVVCASPIDWNRVALDMPLISFFRSKRPISKGAQTISINGYDKGKVLSLVRQAAKEAMGRLVADDVPLMANGLDSLRAVILAQALSQKLGLSLGSVFALNHPTIDDMTNALMKEVTQPLKSPTPSQTRSEEPIAIVGMACRLPGNVTSPEEFWEMLASGKDCVSNIPSSRFDIDPFYDPNPDAVGRSYTRRGAFMSEVESFDHEFFGIPLVEARAMDPQQRLLLEVAYEAFYTASYDKESLHNRAIGIFIGQMNQDWAHIHSDEKISDPYFGAGSSASITSNRISYLLGLTGPSMTLDTACSSSLVAVDLAIEKLRNGVCEAALVGGVNVMLSHRSFVGCCAAKMLSFKGRCATFDASADGYCRGEGVGAVVLKRLSDAKADGNQILALVRGVAVNQDGRSASLTAPNGLAQEAVMNKALAAAGLQGCDIDYVECHGTGTPLGDPIEVGALKKVLSPKRKKPVVLGAVKTNIGHLEGAAGVVGLIKAIEVLRHARAPGNVHFKTLNPKIDLTDFHVVIPNKLVALGHQTSLFAGVSSFGFGGTNAHVILESWKG